MKKVVLVFGTRPKAIKMAPLVKEFQRHLESFGIIVCVTGQHRKMLDQVLELSKVTLDYDLNIMRQGQDLYDMTVRVLMDMRDMLREATPDAMLVHGDTTMSMAAVLAVFYQQIPVGYIGASPRTHNIYSPWPEEMNCQVMGRIAAYNFVPTWLSKQNLMREDANLDSISITGNTVIDALWQVVIKIKTDAELDKELEGVFLRSGYDVNRLVKGKGLALTTGHRWENSGDGFIHMCTVIKDSTRKYPEVDFVYPMHLNPNVRKPIHEVFGEDLPHLENMLFIEPSEYLSLARLVEKLTIVLIDSGGTQEEAPGLGKPVLMMRDTIERPEALAAGTVKLVGMDHDKIVSEVSALPDDTAYYDVTSKAVNPYGDGLACGRTVEFLDQRK